jgi:hypothetical protein
VPRCSSAWPCPHPGAITITRIPFVSLHALSLWHRPWFVRRGPTPVSRRCPSRWPSRVLSFYPRQDAPVSLSADNLLPAWRSPLRAFRSQSGLQRLDALRAVVLRAVHQRADRVDGHRLGPPADDVEDGGDVVAPLVVLEGWVPPRKIRSAS